MGAFLDAQTALADLLCERDVDGAVWEWNARGWSALSPNSGQRWRCRAAGLEGVGDTGEEALVRLVEALRHGSDSL